MRNYRTAPTALVGLGQIQDPNEALYESLRRHAYAYTQGDNGLTRALDFGGAALGVVGGALSGFGQRQGLKSLTEATNSGNQDRMKEIQRGLSHAGNFGGFANILGSLGGVRPMYAYGGEVPPEYGGYDNQEYYPGGQYNAELEGGEMVQHPDGSMQEVYGPEHEQGGVLAQLSPATRIYSDRIKIDGVSIADRNKKRVKRSATLKEILERDPYNTLLRKSWERTVDNSEKLQQQEMEIQNDINNILSYEQY